MRRAEAAVRLAPAREGDRKRPCSPRLHRARGLPRSGRTPRLPSDCSPNALRSLRALAACPALPLGKGGALPGVRGSSGAGVGAWGSADEDPTGGGRISEVERNREY